MKLKQSLIYGSSLLTSAAAGFVLCHFIMAPDFPPPTLSSERILTYNAAKQLMDEYRNESPLYVKYFKESTGVDAIEILKGFVFDAGHIREILTNNHSRHGQPDKILFYLAKNGSFMDTGNPPREHPKMQLIAIGMLGNTILFDDTTGEGPSIFDKAEPCPPKCPE